MGTPLLTSRYGGSSIDDAFRRFTVEICQINNEIKHLIRDILKYLGDSSVIVGDRPEYCVASTGDWVGCVSLRVILLWA